MSAPARLPGDVDPRDRAPFDTPPRTGGYSGRTVLISIVQAFFRSSRVGPISSGAVSRDVARLRLLLAPRFHATRNRFQRLDRRGRLMLGALGLLGVGFWSAIFIFFYRVLRYFLSVPDFGPILTYKLLGMVFLTFFSIL